MGLPLQMAQGLPLWLSPAAASARVCCHTKASVGEGAARTWQHKERYKGAGSEKKTHNQILPPGPPTLLGPPWGFAWQQRDGQVWGLGSHMGKKSPTLGVEGNVFVAMCLWQRNRFWCMGKWWVESTLPGF